MKSLPGLANGSDLLVGDGGIETALHTACVKAGAGAALQVGLDRLPFLKPFVPTALRRAGSSQTAEDIQRRLVQSIYRRYGLKPAGWEIEAVMAVAQTQAVMTPLATREGLKSLLRTWLPDALSRPLVRYTPLEPLVTATVAAVAVTWATGRYADSVCRLRKAGADWLPAPLAGALNLAPATLKSWSAEALSMALPPLKLAAALGRQLTAGVSGFTGAAAKATGITKSAKTAKTSKSTKAENSSKATKKSTKTTKTPRKRAPSRRSPA